MWVCLVVVRPTLFRWTYCDSIVRHRWYPVSDTENVNRISCPILLYLQGLIVHTFTVFHKHVVIGTVNVTEKSPPRTSIRIICSNRPQIVVNSLKIGDYAVSWPLLTVKHAKITAAKVNIKTRNETSKERPVEQSRFRGCFFYRNETVWLWMTCGYYLQEANWTKWVLKRHAYIPHIATIKITSRVTFSAAL